MAWITLPTVKHQLGITATAYDSELVAVLRGVESAVARYLGYDPSPAETTEYYDGDGTTVLTLRRMPVISITSVYLDREGQFGKTGAFGTSTLLTAGTDYTAAIDEFGAGRLLRLNGFWPLRYERATGRLAAILRENPGCVKVTYSAGAIDPAIALAGMYEAKALWAVRLNGIGAMMSESLDGRSIGLTQLSVGYMGQSLSSSPFVSPLAGALLQPFRRTPLV